MTLQVRQATSAVELHDSAQATTVRSAVMFKVGGRQYPMKSVPQCKVCQHHQRQEIESLILQGVGYAAAIRRLGLQDEVLSRNISDHIHHGHMPTSESITRVIVEDRAKELGKAIDGEEQVLADHIAFARVGVARVFDRMQRGEVEPSMTDAIRLARLLAAIDMRAAEEGADQDAMLKGFMVYMKAIQKNCSPEQIAAIGRDISGDPVMKGLLGRSTPIEANAQEGVA